MPTITAQTLRHLLSCERRIWLDAHGDPALRSPIEPATARLYALGNSHERAVHAATAGPLESIPVTSWDEGVALTADLMARGVPVVLGAYLEVQTPLDLTERIFTLRGQVDRLVRVAVHGEMVYSPVEIKRHAQPEDADWLQLDFYAWLLGQLQGTVPPGELWLGADTSGRPRRRLPHDYDDERLMAALGRIAALLGRDDLPPDNLTRRCQHCPWHAVCETAAQHEQRLDLLYRVSARTRAALHEAGIAGLEQLAALAPEALQQVRGIGPTTASQIRANAQAWLEQRAVWYGPRPDGCEQAGWMFDLETLADGTPWCMGWCDVAGHTQIALVAPVQLPEQLTLPDGQRVTLVPDSDVAWETLCAAVAGDGAPLFHWSAFDAAVLRATGPTAVRAALEPRLHDLYRSFAACLRLPTRSLSIKVVAQFLGFEWPGYADWFAAYADYRYWLESGRADVLLRTCTYQRADVQSMAHVWRWMAAHAPGGDLA